MTDAKEIQSAIIRALTAKLAEIDKYGISSDGDDNEGGFDLYRDSSIATQVEYLVDDSFPRSSHTDFIILMTKTVISHIKSSEIDDLDRDGGFHICEVIKGAFDFDGEKIEVEVTIAGDIIKISSIIIAGYITEQKNQTFGSFLKSIT